MLVVLAVVTVLVFFMTNFLSDPIEAIVDIQTATEADIQAVREQLGLNDPILVQFGRFVSGILKGDFGTSYVYKTPVLDLIFQRVPATAEIVLFTAILTLVIAIPLGRDCRRQPADQTEQGDHGRFHLWHFSALILDGHDAYLCVLRLPSDIARLRSCRGRAGRIQLSHTRRMEKSDNACSYACLGL